MLLTCKSAYAVEQQGQSLDNLREYRYTQSKGTSLALPEKAATQANATAASCWGFLTQGTEG